MVELRESRGMTQEEVSHRTGIPYDSYRRYEYGGTFPRKDALIALAKLYGMSPGELFDELIGWRG